jgi:hypothetical protein
LLRLDRKALHKAASPRQRARAMEPKWTHRAVSPHGQLRSRLVPHRAEPTPNTRCFFGLESCSKYAEPCLHGPVRPVRRWSSFAQTRWWVGASEAQPGLREWREYRMLSSNNQCAQCKWGVLTMCGSSTASCACTACKFSLAFDASGWIWLNVSDDAKLYPFVDLRSGGRFSRFVNAAFGRHPHIL